MDLFTDNEEQEPQAQVQAPKRAKRVYHTRQNPQPNAGNKSSDNSTPCINLICTK